ncbi:MAG: protein kinase domain-containing protein [Acidimicrobiales bacterium]
MEVIGGRYEPQVQLGQGGMATVWSAWDTRLHRPVAIKVLSRVLGADPSFVARFGREARHAAALSHPNIVTVFDFAPTAESAYLVMELVEGESLADRLRRLHRLDVAETAAITSGVLAGLGAAHRRRIVHRDVKPSNILLGPGGTVKVADFGIARVSTDGTQLTDTGMVMGTVGYLAPEQCAGEPATDRSDLYAVGCVAFECLAGQPVFSGETPVSVMYQHQQAPPADVCRLRPEVPAAFGAAIGRALSKDPRDRFASAAEMRRAVLGSVDIDVDVAGAALVPGPALAAETLVSSPSPPTTTASAKPTRAWRRTLPGPRRGSSGGTRVMPGPPSPGSRSPRRRADRRRRAIGALGLLAVIGLIAGLVAATSGGAPGGLAIHRPPSTTTTSTTVAGPSKHRAAAKTASTVSLGVVACDTSSGIDSGTTSVPSTMSIRLPKGLASTGLAFYASSDDSVAVLAPSGWSCAAAVGADGSASLVAVPPDEASDLVHGHHHSIDPGHENKLTEAITLSDTGACAGCATTQACGLFGQAASTPAPAGPGAENSDNSNDPLSPKCDASPPAQEAVTRLSGSVVAFEDPPGLRGTGVPSGGVNPANGILTYSNGDTGAASYLSTCTLPENDHSLCTAVLNDVLKRYWNF